MNSDFQEVLQWIVKTGMISIPAGVAFALISNYAIFHFMFRSEAGKRWFAQRRLHQHAHNDSQIKNEMKHALIPESILSVMTLFLLNSDKPSPIRHFFHISWNFSWSDSPRILAESVLIFCAYEIYYYFLHVAIHRRKVYKYFHQRHHMSIYPTPQAGTSVDILEAISFYTFFFTLILCPLHIVSILLVSLNIKIASLTQHAGHEFFPKWWRRSKVLRYFNSTMYHQMHHSSNFNRNFGFQTSFLDRTFKTIDPAYLTYEAER
jgi:lathosterol oxidase